MMDSSRSTAWIVAIVGGALLIVCSFLTWATVSIDEERFAELLGVDVSVIEAAGPAVSESVTGFDGSDGWITLISGAAAIGLAAIAMKQAKRALAIGIIVAGLVGGLMSLYDIVQGEDNARDDALGEIGPIAQQIGATADEFLDIIDISIGIGLYGCLLGGVLVIVGGVMGLGAAPKEAAAGDSTMGMTAGSVAATSAATTAPPMPSSTPPPVMSPPDAVPPSDPPPSDSGDAGGGSIGDGGSAPSDGGSSSTS
jgi:hypothetical protein